MLNVTLQRGDEEFCETQEEATYSFKVEATHLEKGEQVALAIPGNCEFTTPANLIGSASKCRYCDMVSAPATLALLWHTSTCDSPTPIDLAVQAAVPCLS
jgi:hypothetical protein